MNGVNHNDVPLSTENSTLCLQEFAVSDRLTSGEAMPMQYTQLAAVREKIHEPEVEENKGSVRQNHPKSPLQRSFKFHGTASRVHEAK